MRRALPMVAHIAEPVTEAAVVPHIAEPEPVRAAAVHTAFAQRLVQGQRERPGP